MNENKIPNLRFSEFTSSWKANKLRAVSTFLDSKRIPLSSAERDKRKGEFRYYGASGVIDFVDDYIFDGTYILLGEDGANILNRSTKLAFVVEGKFWVNNHAHVIKANGSDYFLSESLERIRYEKYNTGTAQPKLNAEVCKNIVLNLPDLPEQEKIANFLTAIDQKINQLTRKKELLEAYKKGVMQQLFKQEIRFKDDDGNDFPDWEERRLGDFLIKHDEKTTINNQYPVLTSSQKGIFFQKDYFLGQVASKINIGYNVVPRGYFTYRHMSDTTAFVININNLVDKGIVSTLYPVFTTSGINDEFLQIKLNYDEEFKKYSHIQKQGGSRTYMYFSKLEKLTLTLPSINEQEKITVFLKSINLKIESTRLQLTQTKQFKKGLLQQMFV